MSSKEMQSVNLNLELSHWCKVKDDMWNTEKQPISGSEPTHEWEFKIKDANSGDMRHYIEKIVINLHETFAEPVQEFTKPPFVVRESGYGNFEIIVDIYFKGLVAKDPARKIQIPYQLFLNPSLEQIRSGNKDKLKRENTFTNRRIITVSHKDPNFIKKLVKGGGQLKPSSIAALKINTNQDQQISSSSSSSVLTNKHSSNSSSQKSSSTSKTKSSSSLSSSKSSSKSEHRDHHRDSHHHHSSSKSKSSHERDKTTTTPSKSTSDSTKEKAKKPDTFKNLFGEPIKKKESSSKAKEVIKDATPKTSNSSSSSSKYAKEDAKKSSSRSATPTKPISSSNTTRCLIYKSIFLKKSLKLPRYFLEPIF